MTHRSYHSQPPKTVLKMDGQLHLDGSIIGLPSKYYNRVKILEQRNIRTELPIHKLVEFVEFAENAENGRERREWQRT